MTRKHFWGSAAAALCLWAAAGGTALAADGTEVSRIDHYVKVKSVAPSMNGQDAMVYVREVVQAGAALRGGASLGVVLMVHGSGTPAYVGYDVQFEDYSWAAYLAKAGFDVFTLDLEGYGRSSRPPAMNDACNAPPAIQPQFIPSVIKAPCGPTFTGPITHIASDWNDIDTVVDYLRSLRRVDKINIVGWSQGGARVGGYAAQHPDKIARIATLAPNYLRDRPNTPPNFPAVGTLGTQSEAEFRANWDRQVGCPDQYDEAAFDSVWADMQGSDPVGATWGTGVRRAPIVPLWGHGKAMVSTMNIPYLMMYGEHDKQVLPQRVRDLYEDYGGKEKVIIEIACASHMAHWEKRSHLMVFQASLEWLRDGNVDGVTSGQLKY
jgi:pimeloyl-ACP methyl ester carboxylesterase